MKRLLFGLLAAVALGLFGWAAYLVLSAPPAPAFSAANHDAVIARLDHTFRVAAYVVTWAIQLGYVAWLGQKWQRGVGNGRV
jgi:hypothetical protein